MDIYLKKKKAVFLKIRGMVTHQEETLFVDRNSDFYFYFYFWNKDLSFKEENPLFFCLMKGCWKAECDDHESG